MSIASWEEEFYPIGAFHKHAIHDPLAAAEHSLRKWRGLTGENLRRHSLIRAPSGSRIWEVNFDGELTPLGIPMMFYGQEFYIDGSSCSLCQYAGTYDADDLEEPIADTNSGGDCDWCPFAKYRGEDCQSETEEEHEDGIMSPWDEWFFNDNPIPMIAELEGLVDSLRK